MAGNCHEIPLQNTLLIKLLHDCHYAAGQVEVLDVVLTCRCKVTEVGNLCRDFVCAEDVDLNACLVGECGQMEHRVG